MIIEMYILLQILTVSLFLLAWYKHEPFMWVLAFIFSAINIFTSYDVEYVTLIYLNGDVTAHLSSLSYPVLSYISMIFLAISMLMFFWDIFNPKQHDMKAYDQFNIR